MGMEDKMKSNGPESSDKKNMIFVEELTTLEKEDQQQELEAKWRNSDRSLKDKIFGRNKTSPFDIAHERGIDEDKSIADEKARYMDSLHQEATSIESKRQEQINASHTEALYEDWKREFRERCKLNFSTEKTDVVRDRVITKQIVIGTIDGRPMELMNPDSERVLGVHGIIDGVKLTTEQATRLWRNMS